MATNEPTSLLPSVIFGRRVRDLRLRRGWTQRYLRDEVRKLGISMHQPTLVRIEHGTRSPTLDEAVAIAAVLDVIPEMLYRDALSWNNYLVAQKEDPGVTPELASLRTWAYQCRQQQPQRKED